MKLRVGLFVLVLAVAAAVATGVGVPAAFACDTSYWNLGCQTYSPDEGHTGTDLCCSTNEAIHSTFNTYSTVKAIKARAGGGWFGGTLLLYYGDTWYTSVENAGSDRVGCYNHHTGSMFVNCRHFNY